MKKVLMAICLSMMAVWSMGAMAEDIAVVNMQTIFKTSPKARAINADLKRQFSSRKADIIKMGKALRIEIQNYQKNQAVLGKTKLAVLQGKISQQSLSLRQKQAKFQRDLLAEQNKKMAVFLNQVKAAVAKVAGKKGLELVLPSNAVLYSKNKLDITPSVLSVLD